jgi:hypothetical protein
MKRVPIFIFFIISGFYFSCVEKENKSKSSDKIIVETKSNSKDTKNQNDLIEFDNSNDERGEQNQENFKNFLAKFLKDSKFRYQRIEFPFPGFNSEEIDNSSNSEEIYRSSNYIWTKEDWEFYFEEDKNYHKNPNIRSEITVNISKANWRLYIEDSGYDINYEFQLKSNKWYLVRYSYKNI